MSAPYDALIVGGGHNGLVCAAYLAKAGRSVCVVERRDILGGAAATEELWPGYRLSTASYAMTLLQPKIILDLDLKSHGFEVLKPTPLVQVQPDGRSIVFWDEIDRLCAEFAKFSPADAAAYPDYRAHLASLGPIIRKLIWEVPIDFGSLKPGDLYAALKFGLRNRAAWTRIDDLYQLFTQSVDDYLSRWFTSDVVRTAIGFYAGGGGGFNAGMRTPGTAFALVRSLIRDNTTAAGGTGYAKGGMGAVSAAIAGAARQHGATLRTGAEVASVAISSGRATGVVLASGEEIRARAVVANASAKHALLDLVDPAHLPGELVSRLRGFRSEGTAFKINMVVGKRPEFPRHVLPDLGGPGLVQFRIAPDSDYMDEAHHESQLGRYSRRPFLTVMIQSLIDESLVDRSRAAEGSHVVSLYGGHAPYTLKEGSWDQMRPALYETAMRTLEDYAPGFGASVLHAQTLTPLDYERIFGLPGGQLHQGEMSPDQLFFMRPAPKVADFTTPVEGLFLCGSSSHPGGGVTGIPGHNAAAVVNRALGR